MKVWHCCKRNKLPGMNIGQLCHLNFLFRSPVSKFLLDGGQCQSWLLGNRIITITTSGGYKVRRAGLCDRCLLLARAASFSMEPAPPEPAPQGRRRHKTAAPTTKTEKVTLKKSSKDDLLLHRASPPKDSDSLTDVSTGGSGQDLSHSSSLDTRSDKIQAMDSVLMGKIYQVFTMSVHLNYLTLVLLGQYVLLCKAKKQYLLTCK